MPNTLVSGTEVRSLTVSLPSEKLTRWQAARGLLKLAFPLILSNLFWTLQLTIDRILLAQYSSDTVAACMAAVMLFAVPFLLLQITAGFVTTFVAQYIGARRPERVGPVINQALYFSLGSGLAFLGLIVLAEPLVAWIGHAPHLQVLEATYFRIMTFCTLPLLIVAVVTAFFDGRGDSWTVLWFSAVGLLVNAVLDYLWIFGYGGFPEWGIAGAGWATVIGAWTSALLALAIMWRPAGGLMPSCFTACSGTACPAGCRRDWTRPSGRSFC
jgi:multidrug resistance protein, MATE family